MDCLSVVDPRGMNRLSRVGINNRHHGLLVVEPTPREPGGSVQEFRVPDHLVNSGKDGFLVRGLQRQHGVLLDVLPALAPKGGCCCRSTRRRSTSLRTWGNWSLA
jgi:hypothetical protein